MSRFSGHVNRVGCTPLLDASWEYPRKKLLPARGAAIYRGGFFIIFNI